MRVLITGGAGFIGANLANRLAADGHHVRVLDDLSAGDSRRLDERVLFTRGDVKDRPKLWTLLQGVECVFHLAARVALAESVLYPREYNDVNVGGTVSVMEAMRDVGVQRVVLASSATVYGEQQEQPLHEEMRPHPLVPYAVTKIAAEYYLFTLGALYGIETVALRIFNAYGRWQALPPSYPPVIPQFVKQALSRGSLVILGDGRQQRDFVYIDDVVDALLAAATTSGVDRRIINVGSGQAVSINDLARLVLRITARKATIISNEQQSGGIRHMVADLTRAKSLLGYEPKIDLETGLRMLLKTDPRSS
jgi:UDP-glucose 4-epimerase